MKGETSKRQNVKTSELPIGNRQFDKRQSRRAVILPVVLFVLVMIGLLSAAFAFQIHADFAATQSGAGRLQTRLAAEAGIERAKNLLLASRFDRNTWYNNPDMLNRIIVWANGQDSRISGTNQEIDETMVYRFSVVADDPTDDRDYIRFGVTDESSKLNINTCTEAQLLHLITQVTLGDQTINPKEIVAAILDWRDTDSTPRSEAGDTEGKYYEELKVHPYRVKNGPFTTVEELLLVKGVTPQILWGEDFDQNGLLTPNENDGDKSFPPDNQDGLLNRGLAQYVTAWSTETNIANDNRQRVYLLADQDALRTELTIAFPDAPTKVDYIVNASRSLFQQGVGGQPGGGQNNGQPGGQNGNGQQDSGQQSGQQGGSPQDGDQEGDGTGAPTGGTGGSGSQSGGQNGPGSTKGGGTTIPSGGSKPPTGLPKQPSSGGTSSIEGSQRSVNFMGLNVKVVAGAKVKVDTAGNGSPPAGAVSRQVTQTAGGGGQRPAGTPSGQTNPSGSTGNPGTGNPGTGNPPTGASGDAGAGKGSGTGGSNPQSGQPGGGQTGGQQNGQPGSGQSGGQEGGQPGAGKQGDGTGQGQQGDGKPKAQSPAALLFGAKMDGRDVDSPLTNEDLPLLMDHLTMVAPQQKKVPGLININTAPRLVLECIEGLTPEHLDGILKVRDGLDAKTASTTAWLVTEGVMDKYAFDKIANAITARGQQFTVESLGYSDFQGMVTRLQAIVELNGPVAQTIYYRDVSYLGGHFPIREEDAKKIRRVH
ncbi:MAG: general secretion pathway protein GspK [Planctomycetes bacterium]|nr:general secretion pathway protein GspK [Planctomycetota bacterium]